jgi:antitoxin CcdA
MRMKKGFSDPPRRFEHSGRIGSPPKSRPKRAVNISVDAELLKVAKEMDLNLSRAFEDTLRKLTREERERRLQKELKAFVDSHNALIERYGICGEELLEYDDPPV